MKNSILKIIYLAAFLIIVSNCTNSNSSKTSDAEKKNESSVLLATTDNCDIVPNEMPDKLVNGESFPVDSNTVNSWIANSTVDDQFRETNQDMMNHTWALWAALTEVVPANPSPSCTKTFRRFETWYTPQDIYKATNSKEALPTTLSSTGQLQFREKFSLSDSDDVHASPGDIVGKVKMNPATAKAVYDNRYYDFDKMDSLRQPGVINTIVLPNNSIALKPVYRVMDANFKVSEGVYRIHVWSGRVDGETEVKDWKKAIYVCTDPNDPRIDGKEYYSVNNFMHHKMTAAEAYTYNHASHEGGEGNDTIAAAGDVVLVLGMHAATREATRWTWQSYYWSTNPDNPYFPSSKAMVEARNNTPGLDATTKHYAVSLGYSMLSPGMPYNYNASTNIKNNKSVYSLNPFIEGTFTTEVFENQYDDYYEKFGLTSLFKEENVAGLTSSCMGCHSQAVYLGPNQEGKGASSFIADQYVPRNAPWFKGEVQTDFLWSLSGSFEGFKE